MSSRRKSQPATPSRQGGRRRIVIVLAALLAIALGFGAWQYRRANTIAAGLPVMPDLAARPAELVDRVTDADRHARRLFGATQGIATLSHLYHANGYADEAMACDRLLIALEPGEPRWPHLLATLLAGYGRLDEARSLWRETIRLAPDYLPARVRLGDAAFKAGDIDTAGASYRAVLAKEPANSHALLGLARIELANGDSTAARAHLEAAVTAQPRLAGGWALLATLYDRADQPAAARVARQRAAADRHRDPPDPWVDALVTDNYDPYQIAVAAEIAGEAGRDDDARRGFERAVALAPTDALSRRLLGKFHAQRGESAAARVQLEKAVALDPTNADGWLFLLQTCTALGDHAASERALAEGLRHCPDSPGLHRENGRRLAARQQFPAAIVALQEAKRLRPQEASTYIDLAIVYLRTGQTDKGVAEFEAAHIAEPAHPMPLISLARHAFDLRDEASARLRIRQLNALGAAQAADVAALTERYETLFGRRP